MEANVLSDGSKCAISDGNKSAISEGNNCAISEGNNCAISEGNNCAISEGNNSAKWQKQKNLEKFYRRMIFLWIKNKYWNFNVV